jgi:hypothetical protein
VLLFAEDAVLMLCYGQSDVCCAGHNNSVRQQHGLQFFQQLESFSVHFSPHVYRAVIDKHNAGKVCWCKGTLALKSMYVSAEGWSPLFLACLSNSTLLVQTGHVGIVSCAWCATDHAMVVVNVQVCR